MTLFIKGLGKRNFSANCELEPRAEIPEARMGAEGEQFARIFPAKQLENFSASYE